METIKFPMTTTTAKMTYGTLPVVSYPLELDSLIQFASTDGYNSAFYMVP